MPTTLGKIYGGEALIGGSLAVSIDFNNQLPHGIVPVFMFVMGITFILMLAAFGSIVIPATTIALNLRGSARPRADHPASGRPRHPHHGRRGDQRAVIMVAVFAAFGALSLEQFKQLSIGLAVAVLLAATVVRGVLLPTRVPTWHPAGSFSAWSRPATHPILLGPTPKRQDFVTIPAQVGT